jgi:hypothetical protein
MKKAALHLHAIPSDRRETRRVITPMQKTLYIIWPDGAQSEATIDSIQFGKMVIRLSKDTLPDCKVGSSYSIKGVRGAETIISGSWDLTAVREDGDFRLLIISHSTLKNLTYLSQYLDPIITLMSNRSRLFSFSDSAGEKWYSRHLTELKDCPVPIDARIWFGNRQVGCIFDFSSGSRELTSIDLVVLPEEKALLVSGLKTVLDYSFLGVRYLYLSMMKTLEFYLCLSQTNCLP